eukprot:5823049-Prymnesium_polylepis.2
MRHIRRACAILGARLDIVITQVEVSERQRRRDANRQRVEQRMDRRPLAATREHSGERQHARAVTARAAAHSARRGHAHTARGARRACVRGGAARTRARVCRGGA